jgi:acid phosphatase class B
MVNSGHIGEIDEGILFHSQELWVGDTALCPDSHYYSHK